MSGAINQRSVSRMMRGASQQHMVRRRDATGDEMTALARIMNEPNPNPEEVHSYIRDLMKKGHVPSEEAKRTLATIPHDPDALRAWAKLAFTLVMHQGIHAHAAFPKSIFPSETAQAPPANPTVPTNGDAGNQPPQGPQPPQNS